MDNDIQKLITLADNIQAAKLGKRGKDIHPNSQVVIDEYLEWRAEAEALFEQYFDISNTNYCSFTNQPRDGNGYTLIGYFNQQYPIFKVLIKKIESMKLAKSSKNDEKVIISTNNKAIFISHAKKDKEIADAFVDIILHGALSVSIDNIFCTSTDGTKIKSGSDWRNSIKESLLAAKINFLIITPNYKESEVCLNEMGAAWVTSASVIPLIVEPINFKTVGIIQEPKQIEKLLDENSLDRIKDIIQKELVISPSLIKSDRWTVKKKEFITRVNKYLSANPFEVPMDRDTFNNLLIEKMDSIKMVNILREEKKDLEKLIGELKSAKDKSEVTTILKSRESSTQIQEFEALCSIVINILSKNSSIINGIIFKSYSGKDVTIYCQEYKEEIDEALANDFINENMDVQWETTNEMSSLKEALDNVNDFLNKNLNKEFYQSYNENFNAPLQIYNKIFWEEVFQASVSFS